MASRVAGKIKLQSVDELLGVPEIAGTQEIEIGRIHAFPNHPFKVLDDEKMGTLVDSIRENGILNPVIVRPDQSGNYEMISGHRRLHAAKIVELKKVLAIVKEMSDDEAIIKMVDANIQREEILPSEKAFAYKMKLDALKRTAGRPTKENACHNGTHLRSDQELALQVGDSARSIQRYIRLTELIPELLDYVDNKKIGLVMAVDLSYLDEQVQKWVYEYFKENGFLKPVQVEALKNYPNLSNVTQFSVISIMNDALPKKSKENLNPDIHEKNGEENKITIPEGVDPELLMKVLGNPSGKLYEHLAEIDTSARDMAEYLIKEMAKKQGVTEELKATDMMR